MEVKDSYSHSRVESQREVESLKDLLGICRMALDATVEDRNKEEQFLVIPRECIDLCHHVYGVDDLEHGECLFVTPLSWSGTFAMPALS